jgi:hypothetical protein
MSGVYLNVSEIQDLPHVLSQPAGKGWPHITVAYTGKHLGLPALLGIAHKTFGLAALQKVTLTKAIVSSWPEEDPTNHDVLIEIEEEKMVEALRGEFPVDVSKVAVMRKPHITVAKFSTEDQAKAHVEALAVLLPRQVLITGVSIKC